MKRIRTTNRELAIKNFSKSFLVYLLKERITPKELVFICIGTPLVSGDSLGPVIGERLKGYSMRNSFVYGTKEEPIHALNLTDRFEAIKKKHPDAYYVAIDASFGTRVHLGNICINKGPLFPGSGVKKNLPPVGDLSITAIVCPYGPFRNKRLEWISHKRIAQQADIISTGIFQSLLYLSLLQKQVVPYTCLH